MKKIITFIISIALLLTCILPFNAKANISDLDTLIAAMTNEEKIAMMLMPSFRTYNGAEVTEMNDDLKALLNDYNFAGIMLVGQNVRTAEGTLRFVDSLQKESKDHISRLFISIDQEGGYVYRLGQSTGMPGNMALAATNSPKNAYESAKIIGKELAALDINMDFAPVVDVNNNPKNPIIGVRAFSDDANTVATYSDEFVKGLKSEGIITIPKHFPGHGDTDGDTHENKIIIDKSYDELKNMELVPYKKLINSGLEVVMSSHIVYPQIENVPSSLSQNMITNILRGDLGFTGLVITDSFDMGAITSNYSILDACILAINAGNDIILNPYTITNSTDMANFRTLISNLASNIGTDINETKVNAAIKRILTLKQNKGLLSPYDGFNLETKITNAKKIVSTKTNHDKEFELAKEAVTVVKNDNDILPLKDSDKTVILYAYESHEKAIDNALNKLIKDKIITSKDNIKVLDFTDNEDKNKEEIDNAKNMIIINAMYNFTTGASSFKGYVANMIDNYIEYANSKSVNTIFMSTQNPYDLARFTNANAQLATYLANGIRFDLDDYEELIPIYGPSVMAGIYKIFDKDVSGKLPVNIYSIDDDMELTDTILYKRGYGLNYKQSDKEKKEEKNPDTGDNIYLYIIISIISILGLVIIKKKQLL